MPLKNLIIPFLLGLLTGALSGDEKIRFLVFGKLFKKLLFRRSLIFAKPVCCKNYICKDGLVSIHGLKIKNKIPFVYLSDCWVMLHKSLASWVLHWQAHYDEKFSKCDGRGKTETCNQTVNELIKEYAHLLSKYARYPKSNIALPQHSGRIIEILVEINRWEVGPPPKSLKEIVESGKGKCHLAISEPDPEGNPNLTPITLEEGWDGHIVVRSDRFGFIGGVEIKIPELPEKYVDWDSGFVIPKEQQRGRGQPLRLKINRIY